MHMKAITIHHYVKKTFFRFPTSYLQVLCKLKGPNTELEGLWYHVHKMITIFNNLPVSYRKKKYKKRVNFVYELQTFVLSAIIFILKLSFYFFSFHFKNKHLLCEIGYII